VGIPPASNQPKNQKRYETTDRTRRSPRPRRHLGKIPRRRIQDHRGKCRRRRQLLHPRHRPHLGIETLSGPGPFTVFAPTDEAFAKLPEGTVEDLLKPENKEKLVAILTYHVVPAKVMAADVKTGPAATVNGKELQITKSDDGVKVNEANVTATDIVSSNGVIHVIDAVVLP
jgi:hypothetical protein